MKLLSAALDLLYPPKCVFCQRLLRRGETELCACCRPALPKTAPGQCFKTDFVSQIAVPFYYEGTVRESLHRYKFSGVTAYAPTYARWMAESVRTGLTRPFDVITWVPLSRRRLRSRGYDQAELLARALSRELDVPCERLLDKIRHTPPQSGTASAEERRANISGCYAARRETGIPGKRVLLVDDIFTTGSTLSEAARMLRLAGAQDVLATAVAHPR